jgi:hypothetical protein
VEHDRPPPALYPDARHVIAAYCVTELALSAPAPAATIHANGTTTKVDANANVARPHGTATGTTTSVVAANANGARPNGTATGTTTTTTTTRKVDANANGARPSGTDTTVTTDVAARAPAHGAGATGAGGAMVDPARTLVTVAAGTVSAPAVPGAAAYLVYPPCVIGVVPPGHAAPLALLLSCLPIAPALANGNGSNNNVARGQATTVLVTGRRGAGRRTLARAAASLAGLHYIEVSVIHTRARCQRAKLKKWGHISMLGLIER